MVNDFLSNLFYFRFVICMGPKFDFVATATLCLEDVHVSVKSHDLILENLGFDHFCCRLAAESEMLCFLN